jgi:hypothetical protein
MTITLKMIDANGAPLDLPDHANLVLVSRGKRVATGVPGEGGRYTFDAEPADGLAVALHVETGSDDPLGVRVGGVPAV